MSSLAFMGFFCLAEGKRVMTTRPNSTRIWHAHYTSTIQCADGTFLPRRLHLFISFSVRRPPIRGSHSNRVTVHRRHVSVVSL